MRFIGVQLMQRGRGLFLMHIITIEGTTELSTVRNRRCLLCRTRSMVTVFREFHQTEHSIPDTQMIKIIMKRDS